MASRTIDGALTVAIVGCGQIGRKRAAYLGSDRLVACYDVDHEAAEALARQQGARPCATLEELLEANPDVVVVATTHDALAPVARVAVAAGADVLVEKPGGRTPDEVAALAQQAAAAGRLVKVGFNHRFHPGIARAVGEARSGEHGDVMFVRGRYGHGGRLGYEREWRARPELSGGGELVDQGMHLLDLCHWLVGELPLHSVLLRTNYWEVPVEDNAVLILAVPGERAGPWATFHVSWSEWKNEFALEIYCKTAKLQVTGLWGSYGPQKLRIYRMGPELGQPELEEISYGDTDASWEAEWAHFRHAVVARAADGLLGDLRSARYALEIVRSAYASERP